MGHLGAKNGLESQKKGQNHLLKGGEGEPGRRGTVRSAFVRIFPHFPQFPHNVRIFSIFLERGLIFSVSNFFP